MASKGPQVLPEPRSSQVDITIDVQQRVEQLEQWQQEWVSQDTRLARAIDECDGSSSLDRQRGLQYISARKRLELRLVQEPLRLVPEEIKRVGYNGFHEYLASQFARLTRAQRLLWLNNYLFFWTPEMDGLGEKIGDVRSYRSIGQTCSFLLGGPGGMGKTTFLTWYASRCWPTVEESYNRVPIVRIDAPANNRSPVPLLRRLILECGKTYLENDSQDDLLDKLILYLQQCRTQLIIIDNIGYVVTPDLRHRILEISDLAGKLPIVAATRRPQKWQEGDEDAVERFGDPVTLLPYTGESLDRLLAFIELLLPFTQNSFLPTREIVSGKGKQVLAGPAVLIEHLTKGILRDIIFLIFCACKQAIIADEPCLSANLLQQTWGNIRKMTEGGTRALIERPNSRT